MQTTTDSSQLSHPIDAMHLMHKALRAEAARVEEAVLREVGGPAAVTARTRRHALGKVVVLRVAQDDHLEEEEERVLPVIRQQISETQQFDMAQRLLLDREAQDAGWLLAWLTPHVTATE